MMSTSKCGQSSLRSSIRDVMIRMCQVIFLGLALSIILKDGANAATTINASSLPDGEYELTEDTVIIINQNVTQPNCNIKSNNHSLTIEDPDNTGCTLKIKEIDDWEDAVGNVTITSGKLEFHQGIHCKNFTMTGGNVVVARAISADESFAISGGTISSEMGIVTIGSLTITGGTVYSKANSMSGIMSEGNISITGGNVTAISTIFNGISAPNDGTKVTIGNNAYVKAQGLESAIIAKSGITVNGNDVGQLEADGFYHYGGTSIEIQPKAILNPTNPKPVEKKDNNSSSHTHSFSWVVTKSPTSTSDGEEAYMCSCGEIARTSILPAISAFEEETINKIKNAPANGVVEVETRLFNSFGIGVRDALAARPDVTLKVKFLSEGYKGQLLKVTIPTGIDRKALFEESGWLGLCWYGSTHGYDQ